MAKKALQPVPTGMHTLTPHLWFNGNATEAVEFYKKAFGAKTMGPPALGPDGKIMHVMLKIGDSPLMMADAWPNTWDSGPKDHATAALWVYVEDCDALFNRALEAGCEVIFPMEDSFWGDRSGKVKDPFGHTWAIASHKMTYTPEEIQANQAEWLKSMKPN